MFSVGKPVLSRFLVKRSWATPIDSIAFGAAKGTENCRSILECIEIYRNNVSNLNGNHEKQE